jgi:hypothetical protein
LKGKRFFFFKKRFTNCDDVNNIFSKLVKYQPSNTGKFYLKIASIFFAQLCPWGNGVENNNNTSTLATLTHVCYVINSVLGIFISTNKIFLKIQYFASQIFVVKKKIENFNIFRNNIISVEVAKVVKVPSSLLPCFLLAKFRQKEKYFFFFF